MHGMASGAIASGCTLHCCALLLPTGRLRSTRRPLLGARAARAARGPESHPAAPRRGRFSAPWARGAPCKTVAPQRGGAADPAADQHVAAGRMGCSAEGPFCRRACCVCPPARRAAGFATGFASARGAHRRCWLARQRSRHPRPAAPVPQWVGGVGAGPKCCAGFLTRLLTTGRRRCLLTLGPCRARRSARSPRCLAQRPLASGGLFAEAHRKRREEGKKRRRPRARARRVPGAAQPPGSAGGRHAACEVTRSRMAARINGGGARRLRSAVGHRGCASAADLVKPRAGPRTPGDARAIPHRSQGLTDIFCRPRHSLSWSPQRKRAVVGG
jgi:hypothetical protein